MRRQRIPRRIWTAAAFLLLACIGLGGCKALSDRLTHWNMLGAEALDDPIRAVGGDGVVFTPKGEDQPQSRRLMASAAPQQLVAYYASIFVQQRVNTAAQPHPYPPEYDQIGEAKLRHEADGELKAFVAGSPKVYAIYEKRQLSGHDHVQLTYTAWYPAHPKMKAIDLEEADIDSCVVRVTLDADNAPLLFETIAACGCFHKVFAERWLEDQAALRAMDHRRMARNTRSSGRSRAPSTGRSRVWWMNRPISRVGRLCSSRPAITRLSAWAARPGCAATRTDSGPYDLTDYADLYALTVDGTKEPAPFFDVGQGGKVWGAQRKERFIFSWIGVDAAGQPRSVDQIKMHFDQSTWSDPTIYDRYLRLPPGTL